MPAPNWRAFVPARQHPPLPNLPDEASEVQACLLENFAREAVQQGRVGGFDGAAGDFPQVAEGGFRVGAVEEEETWAGGRGQVGGGEDAGADGEGGEGWVGAEVAGQGNGEGAEGGRDVDLNWVTGGHCWVGARLTIGNV